MKIPPILNFLSEPLRGNILDWMMSNVMENQYIAEVDLSTSTIDIKPFNEYYLVEIQANISWIHGNFYSVDVSFGLIVDKSGSIVCSRCSLCSMYLDEMIDRIEKEFTTPLSLPCSCNN